MAETRQPVDWHTVIEQRDAVLIVASGPSLRGFDFEQLRGKGFTIAINDAVKFAPFADAWFTVDTFQLSRRLPQEFEGTRYVAAPPEFGTSTARCACDREVLPGCSYLRRVQYFSEDPSEICGWNSALGALNFAYHMKAKRIVLFGVDANNLDSYFYGKRRAWAKQDSVMRSLPRLFKACADKFAGREVINASPASAVMCFPRTAPGEALKRL